MDFAKRLFRDGGLVVAISFFILTALIIYFTSPSVQKNTKQVFIPPPAHLEYFALGYNETVADSLWIRAIQDFDACGKPVASDKTCNNSWVYRMLDSVTDLAPNFRIAFVEGATNLDIVVRDHTGAGKLFSKGLVQFPHYWSLEYRAAYHYIFVERNSERASELLLSAFKDGGPAWLPSLAGKIMTEAGKGELALKILTDLLESNNDESAHSIIERRIKKIKDQLATGHSIDVTE